MSTSYSHCAKILALSALLALSLGACSKPQTPDRFGSVAPFTLVDHTGAKYGTAQLKGQVWAGNFIFTSCPSICPVVNKAMRNLQDKIIETKLPLKLVTFSVDPKTDTPDVLKAYAKKTGADSERWRYLTAPDAATMRQVVEGSFKTAMGEKALNSAGMLDIAHTTKLVLVGPKGDIRGYFASDEAGLSALIKAASAIVEVEID